MPKKPIIVSVINHKGGVGKTSMVVNLGAGLVRHGLKVLAIDLDVQANLTHSLLGDIAPGERSLCEVLLEEDSLDSIIQETSTPNFWIAPAGESLVELEINLASMMGREYVLKNSIAATKAMGGFDVVLIDNPPAISLSTVNSLVASDFYLVPVSCEYLPMVGLKYLYGTVQKVKKLNPSLRALGVALTMYDKRESITKGVEELIREEMNELVFSTVIRTNTKTKSAPTERKTIFQYEDDPHGKGTEDYSRLAEEVLARLGKGATA